jgi:hypothetical protein
MSNENSVTVAPAQALWSTAARAFTIAATRAPGGAHTRSTTPSGHGCPRLIRQRELRCCNE